MLFFTWISQSKSQYIYWYCYCCIWTKITWTTCSFGHLLKLSLLGPRGLLRNNPLCCPSLCRRNPEDRISNHLLTFPCGRCRCIYSLFINTTEFNGSFQLISFMHYKSKVAVQALHAELVLRGVFLEGVHVLRGKWRDVYERQPSHPSFWLTLQIMILSSIFDQVGWAVTVLCFQSTRSRCLFSVLSCSHQPHTALYCKMTEQ